jgi:hypothetical protein
MVTATLGIVTASRAGDSSHNVNAVAAAKIGNPTSTISAIFLTNNTRHKGTPSAKVFMTRK